MKIRGKLRWAGWAVVIGIGWAGSVQARAQPSNGSVATGKLIWSDEFDSAVAQGQPNAKIWKYDTGNSGFGNHELETYCAWGSSDGPCDPKGPNAYVSQDGYLHIVARSVGGGKYTSARLKSEGLQGIQYGRIEARVKMPAGKGIWPAFWMLGENIGKVHWPECGEMDIMETIGSTPSVNHGSIHGPGFTGTAIGLSYTLPKDAKFTDGFHTFGMIWSRQKIEYYIDDPKNIYASFTPKDLPAGARWPFDDGKYFFLLNVAVGGDWPGSPDAGTKFPHEMLVDYVRVYALPDADGSAASK
jgi:beta-glucanase (GH16 family)